MKRRIIAIPLLLAACTAPDASRRALEDAGYEDIKTTGYSGPFRCDEKDKFATGFEATNSKGKRVHGVVCCGFVKGCTIRH